MTVLETKHMTSKRAEQYEPLHFAKEILMDPECRSSKIFVVKKGIDYEMLNSTIYSMS